MSLGGTNSVPDLIEEFGFLSGCCLKGERVGFAPVRVVANYSAPIQERCGIVIFENQDGRYGVIEDSEDYTGHG